MNAFPLSPKKKVLAQIHWGYQDHEIVEFAYELRPEVRPIDPPATNSAGGINMIMDMNMKMNMWANLFQNKTLLQPNYASKNKDSGNAKLSVKASNKSPT